MLNFIISCLQTFVHSHRDSGVFSSIVSWLSTGHTLPSYMDCVSLSEFPWLAYSVLHAEGEYEKETGLWPSLQEELHESQTPVEQALKV